MVFGNPEHEHIQLNEGNVWVGQRMDRNNPLGYAGFVESRRLLMAGKILEAQDAAEKKMVGVPHRMPQYQTLGDLRLEFAGIGAVTAYRRELDLDRGLATVAFRSGEASCLREIIASNPDQVIAIRVSCNKPAQVAFSATLDRPADATTDSIGMTGIRMRGQALPHDERHAEEPRNGVRFEALLRVLAEGGKVSSEKGSIRVEGADSAVLLLAARTDVREKDPEAAGTRDLAVASRPWKELLEAHLSDYRGLWSRMGVKLGGDSSSLEKLATNERIARVRAGASDPALAALYLAFSRYLLIAGSRPGNLPETLQGLWNDRLDPAWDSKYTININTEMNYWPAEPENLSDLTAPLFDLIERSRENGRVTAKTLYGARGFVIHHNTDIWGDTVPIDSARSGMWPMGGAWLSLHLWDHYDYTGDRDFLARRAYPVMREAAEFLLDYLTDDGAGHLVSGPSVSPENRFKLPDGGTGYLTMGPTMDNEIARALFTRVIEAGSILGLDTAWLRQVSSARDRLPKFRVGRYGQLQEWAEDYEEAEPGHRHISHLFALYPDNQITLRATPELARAARVSLERRLASGGGSTGWSRAWIVSYWARLLEGELAWKHFELLLGRSTLPNMFNDGPPFQIDGNFGGAAGLLEMIVQSHSGEIAFLPAIPSAWNEGSVNGMRARGAVELDLTWKEGKARTAVLRPLASGFQTLRPPKGQSIQGVLSSGRRVELTPQEQGTVSLKLEQGRTYQVSFSQ